MTPVVLQLIQHQQHRHDDNIYSIKLDMFKVNAVCWTVETGKNPNEDKYDLCLSSLHEHIDPKACLWPISINKLPLCGIRYINYIVVIGNNNNNKYNN